MRKIFYIAFSLAVSIALVGCTISSSSAISSAAESDKPATPPQGTVSSSESAQVSESTQVNEEASQTITVPTADDQAYRILSAKLLDDYMAAGGEFPIFNMEDFLDDAGASHFIEKSKIIVSIKDEYSVVIRYDSRTFINDVTVYRGAHESGIIVEKLESATDCIFATKIDDTNLLIGADAMDYLYREINLLVAPNELREEVNTRIDAELARYYE